MQIREIVVEYLGYIAVVGLGLLCSIWWLPEEPNVIEATIYLAALWGGVFNYLPVLGLSCIKDPQVKYFLGPVAILSSASFIYGLIQVYT